MIDKAPKSEWTESGGTPLIRNAKDNFVGSARDLYASNSQLDSNEELNLVSYPT